jgi:hypothetical protein
MRSNNPRLTDEEFLDKIREARKWRKEHPEMEKILEYRSVFQRVKEAEKMKRNRRAWSIAGLVAWTLFLFHVYMLT